MKILSLPQKLEKTFKYKSHKNSRVGIVVPEIAIKYGKSKSSALKTRLPILHRLIGSLYEVKRSIKTLKRNSEMGKKTMTKEDLITLEAYIKALDIDMIGYTTVDSEMIFKDKAVMYDNAIVIIMEMRKSAMDTVPSKKGIKEIFRTYHELGKAVNKIGRYMQKMGYNAMPSPAIGGNVSYVPLAKKAGLGAIGKHGLLITDKDFGPSIRIAAIFTDIENLPYTNSNAHDWVGDFCDNCNKCVRGCPANAIYDKGIEINGNPETIQSMDYTKCAVPFANDYGCTLCIRNCTFYQQEYQMIQRLHEKNRSERV